MEYVGASSGAVLGFITKGTRGGIYGWKLGKKLSKNKQMPPTSRSSRRTRSSMSFKFRPYPTPGTSTRSKSSAHLSVGRSSNRTPRNSRRSSNVSMYSRRSSLLSNASSSLSHAGNSNVVQKAGYKRGRKVHKEGRKKKVKVSGALRKKIHAVIDKQDCIGWYKEILPVQTIKPVDNLQQITAVNFSTSDGISGLYFDPGTVLQVASTLYNQFVPASANKSTANSGLFNPGSFKVRVLEQNVVHYFKNNTARTITLKVWDWSPKVTFVGAGQDPVSYLSTELARLAPTGPAGSGGNVGNVNVLSMLPSTIGFTPKMIPGFSNLYTMDETIVKLEAGKEYYHKLKGPNDKLYDYAKYFQTGSSFISNQQKFVKGTIVAMYTDTTSSSLGAAGRFTDIVAGDPYAVLVETTAFTKIALPEQAGFVTPAVAPAAGAPQFLGNRKSAFAIKNWAVVQGAGTVVDMEDENPQTAATTGV